jgi:hypothetical protein
MGVSGLTRAGYQGRRGGGSRPSARCADGPAGVAALRCAMPIRDELIARTIERLRLALAQLAVGEDDTDADEVRSEVERLYRAHVGSGPDLVRRLGSEDLLDVLRSSGTVDGERAYLLAAILEVDAAAIAHGGDAADATLAAALRARALDLVLEAGLAEVGETDIDERVERLRAGVPPERRPDATWQRLHRFALARGSYAEAEDALFAWLSYARAAVVAPAGSAFYDHLDTVDDAALRAGDLPRDEVDEGRAAFAAALHEAETAD